MGRTGQRGLGDERDESLTDGEGVGRHGKTSGSGRVRVVSIGSRVKWVTGKKRVILRGLKTGCGSGRVGSG